MHKKGFSVIEVLTVAVIVVIIVSVTVAGLSSVRVKTRNTRNISDIKQLQSTLELYFNRYQSYPPTLNAGQALVSPDGTKTYLEKIPALQDVSNEAVCQDYADGFEYSLVNGQYNLKYCLSRNVNELQPGVYTASPNAIASTAAPKPPRVITQGTISGFSNITRTSMTANLTRGTGDGILLLYRPTYSIPSTPLLTDGVEYTVGQAAGGCTVAHIGATSSVNVTGLTQYKLYYFRVFEYYRDDDGKIIYNQDTNASNPRSRWTLR